MTDNHKSMNSQEVISKNGAGQRGMYVVYIYADSPS